jgi:hypothetical protein
MESIKGWNQMSEEEKTALVNKYFSGLKERIVKNATSFSISSDYHQHEYLLQGRYQYDTIGETMLIEIQFGGR